MKQTATHIPLLLPLGKRLRDGSKSLVLEARHLREARHVVRSLDALLVAGGGQFDDEYGGPWAHPYALFKWTTIAQRHRVPVFLAGVGVDDLRHHVSRWLLRRVISMAQRVSLRDAGSIEVLRQLGVRRDLFSCADLAFGLPSAALDAVFDRTPSESPFTIGLSPIAFGRLGSWPTVETSLFERYWHQFQALAASLIQSNYLIKIFVTDGADYPLAQMVYDKASTMVNDKRLVQLLPNLKVSDLLSALRNLDAVVASRLHGALLSHVCRVPVLAISYRRKVRVHMQDVGHERFCLDLDAFTASEARQCLDTLLRDHAGLVSTLNRKCEERYKVVEREFASISRELTLPSGLLH